MHQNKPFSTQKFKIFLGRGTAQIWYAVNNAW